MFNKPIDKMNDVELRNAVQILYDAFERQSREYADLLQNLDFDNFAPEARKEIGNTVSEKELETVVKQTEKMISTQATRMFDLSTAVLASNENDMEDPSLIYYMINEDKSKTYYYYNSLDKKWKELEGSSIFTVFEQTADGFAFKGNVIVGGTLKGVEIEGGTVRASGSATGTNIVLRTSANGMNGEIYMGTGVLYPYVKNGLGAVMLDTGNNDFDLKCGTFNIAADEIKGLGLPLVFS